MSRYVSITGAAEPHLVYVSQAPVRLWYVSALAAGLGVLAGFIDFALTGLIHLITNLSYAHTVSFARRSPAEIGFGWWALLIPAAGGLLVGLMERLGSRGIRGGGMGALQEATLLGHSRIPAKVLALKPISAAVAIGAGSPLGREGPTMQTTGAAGTLIASWLPLTEPERRLLLGCAVAGGMAATYRAVIASVLLAIEIALFQVRSRAFIPLMLAAAGAAAVSFELAGPGLLVRVPHVGDYGIPGAVPWYAVFGVICGLLAVLVVRSIDGAKWVFKRLPGGVTWRPAAGGLAVGAIGLLLPEVLGGGYTTDGRIFHGEFSPGMLGAIGGLKLLAFVAATGSGMSGGRFSPTLMTGASFGALFAAGINSAWGSHLNATAFALAGAGAIFGAASRAPLTFTVLTFELAGDNRALIPLVLVNVIATGVARLLLRYSLQARRTLQR